MLKHLDFFTGIGGFKLAAEWAGFETVAFCEINDWCDKNALQNNWPNIPNLKDITQLLKQQSDYEKFTRDFGHIDLLTAGVPCQPASIIGERKGVEDSRWLWPDTLRCVEMLQPTFVVCENPTGILTLDGGDRFGEIVERFQEAGYGVWWETIPASAVGGGHRRERVWIVAYPCGTGLERHPGNVSKGKRPLRQETCETRPIAPEIVFPLRDSAEWWQDQSPVPVVVDGVSDPAFYKEAVIATGNAIVPQVAYSILQPLAEIMKS